MPPCLRVHWALVVRGNQLHRRQRRLASSDITQKVPATPRMKEARARPLIESTISLQPIALSEMKCRTRNPQSAWTFQFRLALRPPYLNQSIVDRVLERGQHIFHRVELGLRR